MYYIYIDNNHLEMACNFLSANFRNVHLLVHLLQYSPWHSLCI
jgi:hypothetical protein